MLNSSTSTNLLIEDISQKVSDHFNFCSIEMANKNVESPDLIFMGGLISELNAIKESKSDRIHLHTLSSRFKNIFTQLLGVNPNYVSVIHRNSLVDFPKTPPLLPKTNEKWTLVYSGRISHQKNITLLIWLCFYLQEEFNEDVKLVLIGEFDGLTHLDHLLTPEREDISFKNIEFVCTELISNLSWKFEKPQIIHGRNHENWTEFDYLNPVIISLSTFYMEDFGYSIKQAIENNIPVISFDWGGLSDFENSIYKIPVPISFVFKNEFLYEESFVQGIGFSIAKKIFNRQFTSNSVSEVTEAEKEYIDKNKLLYLIENALSHFKLSIDLLKNSPATLQCLEEGQNDHLRTQFFDYYRKILAGNPKTEFSIILFPRNSHSWESMNHIIPTILTMTMSSRTDNDDRLIIRNDFFTKKNFFKYYYELISKAQNAFIPRVDPYEINGISVIKKYIKFDLDLIFFLHENGPYAGWNFHTNKLDDFLTSNDVFVGSCNSDLLGFQSGYQTKNIRYIPFVLQTVHRLKKTNIENKTNKLIDFIYVGRISEQKKIHTLILAFSIFKKKIKSESKLHLYGNFDQLGIPILGKSSLNYDIFLQDLVEGLGLVNDVIFHGHVKQEDIINQKNYSNNIYISCSAHLDENFGVAPYLHIAAGGKAILSNWGGFRDYLSNFGESTIGVNIFKSMIGPIVDISELTHAMELITEKKITNQLHFKKFYNLNKYATSLIILKDQPQKKDKLMGSTFLTDSVKRSISKVLYDKNKTFLSFNDIFLQNLMTNYGGIEKKNSPFKRDHLNLVPWVSITQLEIIILDPSLDTKTLKRTEDIKDILITQGENEFLISLFEYTNLSEYGMLY